MGKIIERTVGDLVVNYDRLRKPLSSREREKRKGPYPYYGATCIFDFIDDYIFDGDYILLAEDGTVINQDGSPVLQRISGKTWVNNHAHVLRNSDIVDFDYLYYALKNTKFNAAVTGAVQLKISQANMNSVIVKIHEDISEQKKIAKCLMALDDKIGINIHIKENLLQQATILYKAHFIDMLPYNGQMPTDWHQGTLSEIIDYHDSKRIPLSGRERASLDKIYPYYGAASIMDYVDRYLFDGVFLLLGEDGTVIDDKGFPILQYVEGKFWVNNHAHIITGKNGFTVEMLYLLLSKTNVRSIVTGAVQPKISQANLNKLSVLIPSQRELKRFDDMIQPFFEKIRNISAENHYLSSIRDCLLPRLMSGELDIANVSV